ncbi:MAG: ABC transporter permease [Roseimicrobium sp.]
MMLLGCLHLAWAYVVRHRARTALLALALGLTLALPLALRLFMQIAQRELRARAEATPLVLGAKGSALELTLNALYFRRRGVESITVKDSSQIASDKLADAIPLYVRFHSQEAPIVGTSLDYFAFRRLKVAQGRLMGRLGDCVVGARVARQRGLRAGDAVFSSPEQVFDIAGVYPLKMRVTGILAESHSADDDAVFVDVKTAWIIEGLAHGHEDLVTTQDTANVLEKQQGNVVGTKAVRMYTEVTPATLAGFHFHGDTAAFPLSAALVLPKDAKARALLLGRYQAEGKAGTAQLVQPLEQMDALLGTLFQAERLALAAFAGIGVVVLLIAMLVFALSFKLRRREFATLEDIGINSGTIALVKLCEIVMVCAASACVVLAAWWLVQTFGVGLVRVGLQ